MNTIFVDGAAGTTGLEIGERLAGRPDLKLLTLSESARKDPAARREALNSADVVILCLPDAAAREAVALVDNPRTRIIDASSAHRTTPGWIYGFAEFLPGQATRIAEAKRVSNPGCYPTGFLALVRPLIDVGLVEPDHPVTVNALSGYSGGGKSMIAEFEGTAATARPRIYATSLAHKHVPEMQQHAGLSHPPLFAPSVGNFYRGMVVEVPLALWALKTRPSGADLRRVLAERYAGCELVAVAHDEECQTTTQVQAESLARTDRLKLFVFANEAARQARLVAVLDNLGKGAAGAAVQNLNLMLGLPAATGLF
ncbi:MAG: N-acetyl-gamma-glutamyl-phosphate reductase [Alphaproteobacteria bacterium]|nr:N-acetyl-gamma-glutamyl-phosphate reductase [Alphaproteobacteria bacterium]